MDDIDLISATSLVGYPSLVRELGADPEVLLRAAGIDPAAVGQHQAYVGYPQVVEAIESAARVTATPDLGRQLARRQGIDVLGSVGIAARTAETLADGLQIFERYLCSYTPAIATSIFETGDGTAFFELRINPTGLPAHPQVYEVSLGLALRIFEMLVGDAYRPLVVHVPHAALSAPADYEDYFGARARFEQPAAGFTMDAAHLSRPLQYDAATHTSLVHYLDALHPSVAPGHTEAARRLIEQLLPTGHPGLATVADLLLVHPRTLQRRLTDEGARFVDLVDDTRRTVATRLLRDTELSLDQLSRQLGYAEQSVLTKACHRWFNAPPTAVRHRLRDADPAPSRPTDRSHPY